MLRNLSRRFIASLGEKGNTSPSGYIQENTPKDPLLQPLSKNREQDLFILLLFLLIVSH